MHHPESSNRAGVAGSPGEQDSQLRAALTSQLESVHNPRMQDREQSHPADYESPKPTKELIQFTIHIGNVQTESETALIQYIGGFGAIDETVLVSDGDRRSLRLLLTTIFHKLRELQINLPQIFPQARLKIISSGEVLTRKVYIKFGVGHHKEQLKQFFSTFGPVRKIEFKFDPKTKKSRHFGYITFAKQEDADRVLQLKRHFVGNKFIYCFPCKPFDIRSRPAAETHPNQDEYMLSEDLDSQLHMSVQPKYGSQETGFSRGVAADVWPRGAYQPMDYPCLPSEQFRDKSTGFNDASAFAVRYSYDMSENLGAHQQSTEPNWSNQSSHGTRVLNRQTRTPNVGGNNMKSLGAMKNVAQDSLSFQKDEANTAKKESSNNTSDNLGPTVARVVKRRIQDLDKNLMSCSGVIDQRHKDPRIIVFNVRRVYEDSQRHKPYVGGLQH